MTDRSDIVIVGAGIFGVTAALELKARGHTVTLLDPGPLPRPQAASTDISKVIRVEYGSDEPYLTLAEQARAGWLRWNEVFGDQLYHEVGVTMLTRTPMSPGGFTYESYQLLLKRGHRPERLTSADLARRFPAWNAAVYVDGYFNPQGGYAESGRVVEALLQQAARENISVHTGQTVGELIEDTGRVSGVRTHEGERFEAAHVVIAAGAWTPLLAPDLASMMHSVGQPVFHLKPADPGLFTPPNFAVFSADVSQTGWYGFPVHPTAGVIKLAHHGVGRPVHPADGERVVTPAQVQDLRSFLAETFPALADAPLVGSHLCLYCDTLDGHFWVDRDPARAGLTVAAGGSGHAFKFGPVLGELVADAVEGNPNPHLDRFGWRSLNAATVAQEATRYRPAGWLQAGDSRLEIGD